MITSESVFDSASDNTSDSIIESIPDSYDISLYIISIILLFPVIVIFYLYIVIDYFINLISDINIGKEGNDNFTDKSVKLQPEENTSLPELNEIRIEDKSSIIYNRFKNSCIYFNKDCTLQAKYKPLMGDCVYYEIELVDFPDGSFFLLGYADKSSTKYLPESFTFLSNKLYGIYSDQEEYKTMFTSMIKEGDILGCFYDIQLGVIIFTYNGNVLCKFEYQSYEPFPTIDFGEGVSIKYNFGAQPFLYRYANQLCPGFVSSFTDKLFSGHTKETFYNDIQ
ncbi:hypothetical protein K502DRAFT_355593 [Neoconidiobolus thromboides FSU 785]|nr:hypothetical protein K502DRAFT_355593 [Neoconidiobolus thromboides FSU 785]